MRIDGTTFAVDAVIVVDVILNTVAQYLLLQGMIISTDIVQHNLYVRFEIFVVQQTVTARWTTAGAPVDTAAASGCPKAAVRSRWCSCMDIVVTVVVVVGVVAVVVDVGPEVCVASQWTTDG